MSVAGSYVKPSPEHIGSRVTELIVGTGSTCTIISKDSPTQLPSAPDVGVTEYLTNWTTSKSFSNALAPVWISMSVYGPGPKSAEEIAFWIPESALITVHV